MKITVSLSLITFLTLHLLDDVEGKFVKYPGITLHIRSKFRLGQRAASYDRLITRMSSEVR